MLMIHAYRVKETIRHSGLGQSIRSKNIWTRVFLFTLRNVRCIVLIRQEKVATIRPEVFVEMEHVA